MKSGRLFSLFVIVFVSCVWSTFAYPAEHATEDEILLEIHMKKIAMVEAVNAAREVEKKRAIEEMKTALQRELAAQRLWKKAQADPRAEAELKAMVEAQKKEEAEILERRATEQRALAAQLRRLRMDERDLWSRLSFKEY